MRGPRGDARVGQVEISFTWHAKLGLCYMLATSIRFLSLLGMPWLRVTKGQVLVYNSMTSYGRQVVSYYALGKSHR